jgi:hypothetical protein
MADLFPSKSAADPIAIPMTADCWEAKEDAEFLRQLGSTVS